MALWMGPSKSDFDCSMRHRRSDVLPMGKKSIGDDIRYLELLNWKKIGCGCLALCYRDTCTSYVSCPAALMRSPSRASRKPRSCLTQWLTT